MPGISDTNSFNTGVGDGVSTVFNFTFFAYFASQIKVYTIDDDNVIVDVTADVVIAVNSSFIGGTVTFSPAPIDDLNILIQREVPYTQSTTFSNLTRYKEKSIEESLNNLEMQIQQIKDLALRSVSYLAIAGVTDATIETPIDGNFLIFDGLTGRLKAGGNGADIANAQGYAAAAGAAQTASEAARDLSQQYMLAAQSAATGINWTKARAASTANVNTASPGANIDSIAMVAGDRVLLKNQTAPAENGIYVWNGAAVAMTRAADMDTWLEVVSKVVQIEEGTVSADLPYMATVNTGGTLGTTAITFVLFQAPLQDGAVSTAAKIVDGIISFAKLASAAVANLAEMLAGTSSKLIAADILAQHPGLAKAWVVFDGTAGSPSAASSYNVASITKNGTGDYTINFTNAMPNANYAVDITVSNASGDGATRGGAVSATNVPTTGAVRILTGSTTASTLLDRSRISVVIHATS